MPELYYFEQRIFSLQEAREKKNKRFIVETMQLFHYMKMKRSVLLAFWHSSRTKTVASKLVLHEANHLRIFVNLEAVCCNFDTEGSIVDHFWYRERLKRSALRPESTAHTNLKRNLLKIAPFFKRLCLSKLNLLNSSREDSLFTERTKPFK